MFELLICLIPIQLRVLLPYFRQFDYDAVVSSSKVQKGTQLEKSVLAIEGCSRSAGGSLKVFISFQRRCLVTGKSSDDAGTAFVCQCTSPDPSKFLNIIILCLSWARGTFTYVACSFKGGEDVTY